MPGAKVQPSCADAGSAQGVHKQLLKWISSVFNVIEGKLALMGVQQLLWTGWLGLCSGSPCTDGSRMGVPEAAQSM